MLKPFPFAVIDHFALYQQWVERIGIRYTKEKIKDKDKKLLFQSGWIENGEWCVGFSCNPKY
jgi:hypothetical protein